MFQDELISSMECHLNFYLDDEIPLEEYINFHSFRVKSLEEREVGDKAVYLKHTDACRA
jgi:hypothetical protein